MHDRCTARIGVRGSIAVTVGEGDDPVPISSIGSGSPEPAPSFACQRRFGDIACGIIGNGLGDDSIRCCGQPVRGVIVVGIGAIAAGDGLD